MITDKRTVAEYIESITENRREAMSKLRHSIKNNLPDGFKEAMNKVGIEYAVPHSLYPKGYHVSPELPLPFITIASQKNFIALYHMGIYADKEILEWFTSAYPKHVKTKLDMGKSCIRFKNPDTIPFDLIAELAQKITPQQWINIYESTLNLYVK